MKQLKVISSLLMIITMLLAVTPVQAADPVTFNFNHACPDSDEGDEAIGEAQLTVTVIDWGEGQVAFKFANAGPEQSTIMQIYFDDGTLFGIADIINNGTFFEQGAHPGDLPCGQGVFPPFEVSQNFLASADNPHNGVNPGTDVTIVFDMINGATFADVLAALGPSGDLRIGIHVQNFADGASVSFIAGDFTAISLASFKASCSRGSVNVNWTTGTEIDNAGFNLYRSTTADGARTRLNSKLLAAKGDALSGGSYSFSDASGYGTYYYWLEDVSYAGFRTMHGPALAVVTAPFRSPLYRPVLPSR